jgi:DNA-directed RNA polymerase specialized sigma24 family protein
VGSPASDPELPYGVDDQEYKRIRTRMRAAVLRVWRKDQDVIAGIDPEDVVDEAWVSMAEKDFACEGPFFPFALRVAKNKAIDVLRSAEARRRDASLDAPLAPDAEDRQELTLHDVVEGPPGGEAEYLRGLDEVVVIERLALFEEAIYETDVLTDIERHALVAVRVDGKSGAAVGRELDPPVTGQWVGQMVARAFIKIMAYVSEHERAQGTKGGEADGRE